MNLNHEVYVKLTAMGVQILEDRHIEIFGRLSKHRFKLPPVDEHGYSRFQLWDLMATFGPYLSIGFATLPFETEFYTEEEYEKR